MDALVGSLLALSQMAVDLNHRRPELDINPMMVLPKGQGVKAVRRPAYPFLNTD